MNYYASVNNSSFDWSYLKTSSASDSSQAMAKSLTTPLTVSLFFPNRNDVKERIADYFESLRAKNADYVKVNIYDKDMSPKIAEELRVSKNGQIVLQLGEEKTRIDVGTELRQARKKLPKFDEEFQKAFLKLSQGKKMAYFTRGHGELSLTSASDPSAKR